MRCQIDKTYNLFTKRNIFQSSNNTQPKESEGY